MDISVKEEAVVKTSEKWHNFVSTNITREFVLLMKRCVEKVALTCC